MSLNSFLDPCLPQGSTFKALHVQSKAKQCKNLFLYKANDGNKPLCTLKVKHFFSLLDASDCILLGIEINVYLTLFASHTDQHIFVAKADTTGTKLLKTLGVKTGEIISCFLRFLLSIDIIESYGKQVTLRKKDEKSVETSNSQTDAVQSDDSRAVNLLYKAAHRISKDSLYYRRVKSYKFRTEYSHQQKERRRREKKHGVEFAEPIYNHISLFTRAEKQYLFPESFRNPYKHLVDGKQLLGWWLNVINQTLHEVNLKTNQNLAWECKLSIPGSDADSTRKFHSVLEHFNGISWSNGSIFNGGSRDGAAIYDIPLFPDDPKGRFLEHLVVEGRHKGTSLKQFWEELGIRQEFRLGNLVGIIGCSSKNQLSQDQRVTSPHISFKDYKRLLNLIKGEDYSKAETKVVLQKQIPEIVEETGVSCLFTVSGTKKKTEPTSNPAPIAAPLVNILTGLVKRKKKK